MLHPTFNLSHRFLPLVLAALILSLAFWGCGGSGGSTAGGISDGAKNYKISGPELYSEVPPLELIGGGVDSSQVLSFNPKGPKSSELYDSDQDGNKDTLINSYSNFVNAANRMFDAEIAACAANNTDGAIWTDAYQPDTMPATTTVIGTQYIQIVFPFAVDPSSIIDGNPMNVARDYLTGSMQIINDANEHVNCTVLVNGKDAKWYYDSVANPQGDDYVNDPNWPEEITVAPNVVVLIAQAEVDQVTGSLPGTATAFNSTVGDPGSWRADRNEIRIRIGVVRDNYGNSVNVSARYYVAKTGFDKDTTRPNLDTKDITAFDFLGDDPDFAWPNNKIVSRDTSFALTFNKPVVPETVGRSLIFDRPPFNGNTQIVENEMAYQNPSQWHPVCNNIMPPPLGTNVSIIAFFVDKIGASATQAVIPFRCYPLHQNNLATYILNPLIDLPGSTPAHLDVDNPIKIRIQVTVYPATLNSATADPDDFGSLPPLNLAPCSYFSETFTGGGGVIQRTFTVEAGGRYVNAPVSPNALYYAMGPKGIGVVDLDGNGFTTNHPNFSKPALVTSARFYQKFGNAGQGIGNNYAYGAKANPGNPIGLGETTPVPGINEGSGVYNPNGPDNTDGMDAVVRDSQGRAQLWPDPDGDDKFVNITDMVLGDFLDNIFFDQDNNWVQGGFHISFVNSVVGSKINNFIDTPPTPNPPPLTLPIGMRAVDLIVDDSEMLQEGVFVIMGKEVFAVPQHLLGLSVWAFDTSFIHLEPAELVDPPTGSDEPFPPNPTSGLYADYINTGPLAESSTLGFGLPFGCRQQIGNFLFATDKETDQVRVINSNNMEVITAITGFNDPDGIAIDPKLELLYVSNAGTGYLSVFNADADEPEFLDHIVDIKVGSQPKGICVQPDFEDVFVCNFGSNSISIINPGTNTVRKTLTSLVKKPWDMVLAPRQGGYAFRTGVFHGYISNFGGSNVLVYESGPDGIGGIGYDDILDPVPSKGAGGQQYLPIEGPRGLCYDPHYVMIQTLNFLSGGVFVAHSSGSKPMVSRINFTKQQGAIGPIFLQSNQGQIGGTPGFGARTFEITAQWGDNDNPLTPNTGAATDVALLDYNRDLWLHSNWIGNPYSTNYGAVANNPVSGFPFNHKHPHRVLQFYGPPARTEAVVFPDRLYISYDFNPVIDVINPIDGSMIKTITGLPAPAKVLTTYFKY